MTLPIITRSAAISATTLAENGFPFGAGEMATTLLQTKLYIPPVRPGLVSRPRLIERLNAGLHGKLTLVSAPAGFGKTTLVSEWVHCTGGVVPPTGARTAPLQVAWLSFDEGDNDPIRFLTYLIAALQTIEADVGSGALSALLSPQPPPTEAILTSLINEITALSNRIVLVLDDYHLIEAQPIHDALAFLLRRLPPQIHLVLATREDPPLPLARLRARGQLTELRATDLRFSASEAAEFLNHVMGLDLAAGDVAALERRTEGWIAGLQLASLALQGRSMQGRKDVTGFVQSFAGSHHYVLDYLVEEVLEQQSDSVQTFLIQTCILDRLTGSLCDAVRFGVAETPSSSGGTATGQENGQATLEMLQRANLFIVPLDEERRWYRYHHLFADLLRQRLHQTQSEKVPTLHHRASQWHEQNGFPDEAVEHALRGENIERAAYLIEKVADVVWERGEHTKLWQWMAGLPEAVVLSRPQLCIFQAWKLHASDQEDATEESLRAAEAVVAKRAPGERALDVRIESATETASQEDERWPECDGMKVRGRAATIRAHLAFHRGDVEAMEQHARQALEYLPKQDKSWRNAATVTLGDAFSISGDLLSAYRLRWAALEACKAAGGIYTVLVASTRLAMMMRMQGKLHQVLEIYQDQLDAIEGSGLSQVAEYGFMLANLGEVLAETNDLEGALRQARKGKALAERDRDVGIIGWSDLCLMRVLFSRGDYTGVAKQIHMTKSVFGESGVPDWISYRMADWQVRTWLSQGKLDAAAQWASDRGLDIDADLDHLSEREYIALARILIAQRRLDQATVLLQRLLKAQEKSGHMTKMIQVLILQALTYQAQGDTGSAIATLGQALSLGEERGYFRIFVDEGSPMAFLLYEAVVRAISGHSPVAQYARRLLSAFPVAEPERATPTEGQAPESELIEPLSERELEVLGLLAEGLTNAEIAARLFLALNTVKAHTRNIYGKLGVHSRTQAVARARALGILSSP